MLLSAEPWKGDGPAIVRCLRWAFSALSSHRRTLRGCYCLPARLLIWFCPEGPFIQAELYLSLLPELLFRSVACACWDPGGTAARAPVLLQPDWSNEWLPK